MTYTLEKPSATSAGLMNELCIRDRYTTEELIQLLSGT